MSTNSTATKASTSSIPASKNTASNTVIPSTSTITTPKPKTSTEVPIKKFQAHRGKVRALAWNADGRRLASGSVDTSLRVWQPERDSKNSVEMKGHNGEVSNIKWDPTHPEHLASCSATTGSAPDKFVYFWDIRAPGPTSKVETKGENITLAWSPDGKTVVVGSRADVVTWIDVDTRKVIKEVKNVFETNEAHFSHNGNLLLTAMDGRISINSFPTSSVIHDIAVSPCSTPTFDLDPTGRYLVAGSNDTTITLWETTEFSCLESAGYHDAPLRLVRFSHDGMHLASTSDKQIIISEVPTLKKTTTIPTGGLCNMIAWHPTKPWLAFAADEIESGRPSGSFRIWGL